MRSGGKIIILPGLDGTGVFVDGLRLRLAQAYDVEVITFPPDMQRYADLRAYVAARLPVDDFIIVAESFSGPLATLIAGDRPAGLRGLVFVATFAKAPRRVPVFMARLVRFLPLGWPLVARAAQPFTMGRWATPEALGKLQQVMRQVPAATFAGRLRAVLKVDVVAGLGTLGVPALYVKATRDRLVPARHARDFVRSEHVVQPVEGPHFLIEANPEAVAAQVLRFIARLR